jgi:hypothetical protein
MNESRLTAWMARTVWLCLLLALQVGFTPGKAALLYNAHCDTPPVAAQGHHHDGVSHSSCPAGATCYGLWVAEASLFATAHSSAKPPFVLQPPAVILRVSTPPPKSDSA